MSFVLTTTCVLPTTTCQTPFNEMDVSESLETRKPFLKKGLDITSVMAPESPPHATAHTPSRRVREYWKTHDSIFG